MLNCSRYFRPIYPFDTRPRKGGFKVAIGSYLAVLAVLLVLHSPGASADQKSVDGSAIVATYDDGVITVDEFMVMYRQAAMKYAGYDMTTYKSDLLAYMATDELLSREAVNRGFADVKGEWDPRVIKTKEKAMINQLRRDVILKGVDASEEYVRSLYERSSVRRLTRMISVSNKEDADQVMEELAGGADFVETAKKRSLDVGSAEWDAVLAWVKIGDVPENLENLIFGLEVGEIGGPERTLEGYAFFRVDSLHHKEDIPSYEEARPRYRSKALERKRSPVRTAFMDSVLKARDLRYEEKTMALVIERFEKEGWVEDEKPGRASRIPEFTPDEYAMPVFSFEGGSATLDEYLEFVKDMKAVNPAYFLAGPEEMKRGLSRFAKREIETMVAYEMGMDEVPSVKAQVRTKGKELGVVDLLVEVAGGEESAQTTEETRRAFYEENKWKYTEPGAIVISIITVTDMDIVEQLHEDMKNGIPIDQLAKDYRWVLDKDRTRGRMALTVAEKEEHPEIIDTARRMKVGAVSEPIPVPERNGVPKGLSVIRLLEREPSQVLPFDKVKDEVRTDLNLEILTAATAKIDEYKKSILEKYNYQVNKEILESVEL